MPARVAIAPSRNESTSKVFMEIISPPAYVSPQEHAEAVNSTPDRFADIPPVLRSRADGVSIELEYSDEADQSDDKCSLSTDELSGGSLYVVESALAFLSAAAPNRGFQILYPNISIHAVSRNSPNPHVYCQLERFASSSSADPIEDDEPSEFIDMRIKPQRLEDLDVIFEAISYCASLHPDPRVLQDDDDDAMFAEGVEGQEEFDTFDGDESEELSEVGRAALAHLESITIFPPGVPRPSASEDPDEQGHFEDSTEHATTSTGAAATRRVNGH